MLSLGLQEEQGFVYLDLTRTNLQNLICVLERFKHAGLRLYLQQCHFGKK